MRAWFLAALAALATAVASPVSTQSDASAMPPSGEPCQPSPTATDTSERLSKLRELMAANNVAAYIVPSDDEHGSEYTATPDHRRQWLSGFMGSLGDLVVTRTQALLWTDSRYWVQAVREMDCGWTLMRKGEAGVPSIEKWLLDNVDATSEIGADPRMVSYSLWTTWQNYLSSKSGPSLRAIESNLVDEAWGPQKPNYPDTPIVPLAPKYTGESWQSKVARVRDSMRAAGNDLLVLSALDDCAWLLNLRSGEVPYTPVFRCYVVLGVDDKAAVSMDVFLPMSKVTQTVRDHLCDPDISTQIHDHQDIWEKLPTLAATRNSVALTMPVVYHTGASYKLYTAVRGEASGNKRVVFIASPVLYMKATKNQVEAMGMKRAHVKDAVALVEMLSILSEEVPAGKYWDEQMVVEALDKLRWQQENSHGPSFDTIAAFGVNGALPHYQPSNLTNLRITTNGLFMVDSGGQFSEGTTDVTRTVHFGTPSAVQVEVYTRLLKGCIDLASVKFPKGYTMQNLEVLLRRPLFELGLQYGHGSTHGIGHFLTVHESFDYEYGENFFGSQEPGYYREDDFGMRLENIVQVVPAEVMYKTATKFLTFETTTLVPYDRKLINTKLLSAEELKWLNLYNQRIRISIGPELLRQNKQKVYKWLLEQTQPYC
ncbi:xaa-Pro aminopeptidase 2-like [Thrips palmi]|uniref:Xaa-Pro aminopeptidase 2-like n=1 Tax=Thrips palmi TaxID=161013 RepID=A0A6P8ZYR9_THRPL|nr:xaa-Pro aminopeptidase 2-like [Thrips palmi]XP_034250598.1 xaa-Pro aminopeptidase 2-like [Thrips palmi]